MAQDNRFDLARLEIVTATGKISPARGEKTLAAPRKGVAFIGKESVCVGRA